MNLETAESKPSESPSRTLAFAHWVAKQPPPLPEQGEKIEALLLELGNGTVRPLKSFVPDLVRFARRDLLTVLRNRQLSTVHGPG